MAKKYYVDKIFNSEEIADLLSLFNSLSKEFAHQDYNLFDIEKRSIPHKYYKEHSSLLKLNDYFSDLTPHTHYFLKYTSEAFTRMHTDNDSIIKQTCVTVIETKDLVGGDTLMLDTYTKNKRPRNKYAKRVKRETHGPIGKDVIPVIVKHNDGDSVIYDPKTNHGVTQVEQGHRIVLVSWFK